MLPLTRTIYNEVLNRLNVATSKISETIGEAASQGDLKENAEYHAAREKLGITEATIKRIKSDLAEEIPEATNGGVSAHSLVTFLKDGNEHQLLICQKLDVTIIDYIRDLGADDKKEFLTISINSPVGKALLGKSQGEDTPEGVINNIDNTYANTSVYGNVDNDIVSEVINEILYDLGLDD